MNGEEFALNLLRFLRVFLRGDYSISTILLPGGPIIQALGPFISMFTNLPVARKTVAS